jgi:hypothetical protein
MGEFLTIQKGVFNGPNRSFQELLLCGSLKTPFWILKANFWIID